MPSFRVEVYGDQDLTYLPNTVTTDHFSLDFRRSVHPGATVASLKDAVSTSAEVDAVYLHVGTNDLDCYLDDTGSSSWTEMAEAHAEFAESICKTLPPDALVLVAGVLPRIDE